MKKIIYGMMAGFSVLALANSAEAYTPKTDEQMKQECETRWKKTPEKISKCIKGKKAYQARMEKKAAQKESAKKEEKKP